MFIPDFIIDESLVEFLNSTSLVSAKRSATLNGIIVEYYEVPDSKLDIFYSSLNEAKSKKKVIDGFIVKMVSFLFTLVKDIDSKDQVFSILSSINSLYLVDPKSADRLLSMVRGVKFLHSGKVDKSSKVDKTK